MKKLSEFDQYAEDYMTILSSATRISGESGDYFNLYKIEEVAKHEDSKESLTILDFGCGEGSMELHFSNIFPSSKIVGIDTSTKSIEVADKKELVALILRYLMGQICHLRIMYLILFLHQWYFTILNPIIINDT